MAKEWVLNAAFNRWQFNRPRYVGKLSESIRDSSPRTLKEWEEFYFSSVRPEGGSMFGDTMQAHLEEIGRRLYAKISEQMRAEIDEIEEQDCINYVREVVINRTFEGYDSEIQTVYKQLEKMVGEKVLPAPDEWDRVYNVDFYISVGEKSIGLQIKPTSYQMMSEAHKWHDWMRESHERFQKDQGGKVFIVFSVKEGGTKRIANEEVIDEIHAEIRRLSEADEV